LSLAGVNVADYEAGPGLTTSYSDGGGAGPYTLTISLSSGSFDTDKLLLTINDSVEDAAGNQLDGEWVESMDTESGDSLAGGDFSFRFDVLPGDVDNSGFVLPNDANAVFDAVVSLTTTPGYDPFTDVDGSGFVLPGDANAVFDQVVSFLPGGTPTPPAASASQSSSASEESLVALSEDEEGSSWADGVDAAFDGGLF
ncbi:MAG: hypothetical protein ACF787_13255, partial [Rhodopirellula sp. JB053]